MMIKHAAGNGSGGPKVDLGGSRGHDDPLLASRLKQLQEKVPLLQEFAELKRRLNGPDGWDVYAKLMEGSSNSMTLRTSEIARGTPPRWSPQGRDGKYVDLTPEQQEAAIAKESMVCESEFYMLSYRGPAPGTMEKQQRG
jgi:hypothetical protein